jgi:AAA+ superfamily predicted ATPase
MSAKLKMTMGMPTTPVNPAFERDLLLLLKSGQQVITINGCNEVYRARNCIQQVATAVKDPWTVFTWNPSRAFTWSAQDEVGNMPKVPFVDKGMESTFKDPIAALKLIPTIPIKTTGCTRAIFVFVNLAPYLNASLELRDLFQTFVDEGKFTSAVPGNTFKRPLILLHNENALPHMLRGHAMPLTFPPANEYDLEHAITYVEGSIFGGDHPCPVDLKRRMALSMLGLTRQQGEDVTSMCLASSKTWNEDMLVLIEEAKAKQIGQEGFLTYVPRRNIPSLDSIGGWDNAERYIRCQCQAYTPQGRAMKLKVPRGILALGLPGTGKSLFAKMITRIIYDVTGQVFPTYKLNYDALFAGIVGETEANVRRLLDILAAQRQYILVVDEMEKFLGTSTTETDGGVSRKASAKFLDWLSERVLRTDDDTDYGYVVGTMNSLAGLEPEFLRRFNATFFVDLPDPDTRLDILKIQLRLNHADPASIRGQDGKELSQADWELLRDGTDQFAGSEIEQAVISAREFAAGSHGVDIRQIPLDKVNVDLARPTFEQLQDAVAMTSKSIMARVHGERIAKIRKWCEDIALPVHVRQARPVLSTRRSGRSIDTNN